MKTTERLKKMVSEEGIIYTAGAYDALSAKIIENAGFKALMTSGFAISSAFLGFPDAELYTMTENLNVVKNIVNSVSIPVIADIDTGYGNAINVMRTIREFEGAGVAGVILEDQAVPKRCPICVGDSPAVLPFEEAVGKVKAAVDARKDPNLIIIARTDAFGEDAVKRAKAYAEAGADLVQPISKALKDVGGLKDFAAKTRLPLSIQMVTWLEKSLTENILKEIGCKIAHFPLVPLMLSAAAMQKGLQELFDQKSSNSLSLPRIEHSDFVRFIGFPEIEEIEKKYLPSL